MAMAMDEPALAAMARDLMQVDGMVAVVLGGSRARGTHRPDSDYDVGLYYRGALDIDGLRALGRRVDPQAEVMALGGWGPWMNGGSWLAIDGVRVDWIYRDLDRVRRICDDCERGRYEVGTQAGHPLGFYSHAYAGEVALCRIVLDPAGELAALQARARAYPAALGDTLVSGLWEADFAVRLSRYGADGLDPTYAAGCLFRAVGVLCQALHGHARRWLINEKGMVASAAGLPGVSPGFAERVHGVLGAIGTSRAAIGEAADRAEALIAEVRAVIAPA